MSDEKWDYALLKIAATSFLIDDGTRHAHGSVPLLTPTVLKPSKKYRHTCQHPLYSCCGFESLCFSDSLNLNATYTTGSMLRKWAMHVHSSAKAMLFLQECKRRPARELTTAISSFPAVRAPPHNEGVVGGSLDSRNPLASFAGLESARFGDGAVVLVAVEAAGVDLYCRMHLIYSRIHYFKVWQTRRAWKESTPNPPNQMHAESLDSDCSCARSAVLHDRRVWKKILRSYLNVTGSSPKSYWRTQYLSLGDICVLEGLEGCKVFIAFLRVPALHYEINPARPSSYPPSQLQFLFLNLT
ncbi:hypothetical protein B0H17DRAFT_1128748 [Mycena rosella]|uniref:Uncharacterized protein n=1 Tax=Mycena rosella TaxID=1033263 RepID=A0AAD7DW07_MYCRO|nr:hypothetical protein B0H17DRAFT_1128748 [Mycena rosella]